MCLECHDRVTYGRQYGRWPEQEERSTLLDLPATAWDGGIESLYAQLRHPSSTYRYALAMRDVDPDRGYFAMPLDGVDAQFVAGGAPTDVAWLLRLAGRDEEHARDRRDL